MKFSVCVLIAIAVLAVVVPASADRIILAPTGILLAPGEIKVEAAIEAGSDNGKIYWAGVGLKRLEISGIRFESGADVVGANDADVLGVELAVLPETTLTPGVGIGVWDATDDTPDGRGFYLAVSKVVPLTRQLPLPIRDIRLHAGFGIEGVDGVFAGAEAAIPFGLKLSAEWFQDDFNYALGWGPLPGLQLKLYVLDGDTFYGLQFSPPIKL